LDKFTEKVLSSASSSENSDDEQDLVNEEPKWKKDLFNAIILIEGGRSNTDKRLLEIYKQRWIKRVKRDNKKPRSVSDAEMGFPTV
jgi:hypothetical protein